MQKSLNDLREDAVYPQKGNKGPMAPPPWAGHESCDGCMDIIRVKYF